VSKRVYVLIDAVEGEADQVAKMLRDRPGVKMVDLLEGPPDVIVMLQSRSRQKLAELTNLVLTLVDSMTEGIQVLPVQNGLSMQTRGE